ncbi:uncharacterized protein LOC106179168 [Lingula anatina]|uniref:Uncharacterized protein LOC106179168 n=1 Tax=Lingula anatina TaxID=7574 RepID=A0A1S3K6M3_LINAN|nr:uncharacterized protein LOC106179168 [Lingula anatina]XP_013418153.1 uncharacterized protein LOC106179168 [Lingula anatina]|eukprot:XP_013418152.1 uncharacterized protein LOC106179168 [Lingula anatina]
MESLYTLLFLIGTVWFPQAEPLLLGSMTIRRGEGGTSFRIEYSAMKKPNVLWSLPTGMLLTDSRLPGQEREFSSLAADEANLTHSFTNKTGQGDVTLQFYNVDESRIAVNHVVYIYELGRGLHTHRKEIYGISGMRNYKISFNLTNVNLNNLTDAILVFPQFVPPPKSFDLSALGGNINISCGVEITQSVGSVQGVYFKRYKVRSGWTNLNELTAMVYRETLSNGRFVMLELKNIEDRDTGYYSCGADTIQAVQNTEGTMEFNVLVKAETLTKIRYVGPKFLPPRG